MEPHHRGHLSCGLSSPCFGIRLVIKGVSPGDLYIQASFGISPHIWEAGTSTRFSEDSDGRNREGICIRGIAPIDGRESQKSAVRVRDGRTARPVNSMKWRRLDSERCGPKPPHALRHRPGDSLAGDDDFPLPGPSLELQQRWIDDNGE